MDRSKKSSQRRRANVNIHDVARRARVSIATVSRVVNRIPTVDPELAKRVWKAVDDVGYVPNTQARALVSGRSRLLASWTPPPLEQQQHSWEGAVIATTPGPLTMREALYYSLSHPVSTVIIGCDNVAQLEENVQIARDFTPLSNAQMASINELAAPVAKQSLFFRFTDRSKG